MSISAAYGQYAAGPPARRARVAPLFRAPPHSARLSCQGREARRPSPPGPQSSCRTSESFAPAASTPDGFVSVGDLGCVDEQGYSRLIFGPARRMKGGSGAHPGQWGCDVYWPGTRASRLALAMPTRSPRSRCNPRLSRRTSAASPKRPTTATPISDRSAGQALGAAATLQATRSGFGPFVGRRLGRLGGIRLGWLGGFRLRWLHVSW
jgi:hypothetical protein